ncbi:hypothetical protein ABLO27_24590 [Roseibium sp. SCPC15]|uniref:hypothetical protein n=1 Tax=Roseibium sp. SCP15 TaxID=3141376 RepID=UPI003339EBAD
MQALTIEDNFRNWETDKLLKTNEWLPRAEMAVSYVKPGEQVLDLGCGYQLPKQFLDTSCNYVPCDVVARTEDTIIADLNKREFPTGNFDTTLILGVLEYIPDINFVFEKLAKQSRKVVFSYCVANIQTPEALSVRTTNRWLTHWNSKDLDTTFRRHRFKLAEVKTISRWTHSTQVLGILVNSNKF